MPNLKNFTELTFPTTEFEIGVDEAGRGPIAGDVFAAAVILDPKHKIDGLNDSKKLSEKKRQFLANEIKQHALFFAIAQANLDEIFRLNILWAAMLAMQRAVKSVILQSLQSLAKNSDNSHNSHNSHFQNNFQNNFQNKFLIRIDGITKPNFDNLNLNENLQLKIETTIKGDSKFANIAAASILAKTARDTYMQELDKQFPHYNFRKNKGYPTPEHLNLIKTFGISPIHRTSFAPIKNLLNLKNA